MHTMPSNKRPGGPPNMLSRAGRAAGDGANQLFSHLGGPNANRDDAARLLERLAQFVRAGAWSPELVELVGKAEVLERILLEHALGECPPER
jgi:hypothetical protein